MTKFNFKQEALYGEKIAELTFSELVTIVWSMGGNPLGTTLMANIVKKIEDPDQLIPMQNIIKITDKVNQNSNIQMMFGRSIFETIHQRALGSVGFLEQMTIATKARLLKNYITFKVASDSQKTDDFIVMMAEDICKNLEEIEERTVLTLFDAIKDSQYMDRSHKVTVAMKKLSQEMYQFVNQMALQQRDLVDVNFLISYLEKITHFDVFDFRLNSESKTELCEMIDAKMAN